MAIPGYPLADFLFVLFGEQSGNMQKFLHSKNSASVDEFVECLRGVLEIHPNKSLSLCQGPTVLGTLLLASGWGFGASSEQHNSCFFEKSRTLGIASVFCLKIAQINSPGVWF
ncbi:hypothetical protein DSO57_1023795 [Entomophthora muscae]|uniref:Uncharacterized protein n=1 Tax=Entomophthora muscae TaxID=34485 RepID=A0ACC2SRZ1_9FUNG|nr:hypothetical protein DSO57_1023795 [Entomophthora muscae]